MRVHDGSGRKGIGQDRGPYRASGDALAATAPPPGDEAALPYVDGLPDGEEAVDLTEQPTEKRAPAPTRTRDVQDLHRSCRAIDVMRAPSATCTQGSSASWL